MANLTPTNDIIFKKIFGSKGNEEILKDFLESILERKIEKVELGLNTELLPEYYDRKTTRVDVRALLENKIEVNVEIQVNAKKYSEKRALQHWGKIYINTIEKGEEYEKLRKTICIWIIDGKVYDEFKEYHSKWKIKETNYGITGHFEELEFHIIELKKFRETDIIKPKKKEFWLWFIDHKQKEMMDLGYISNEKIKEAKRQLDEITADKELMDMLIQIEFNEMDEISSLAQAKREGLEEGVKQGIKQNMQNVAKKMKERGLKIEEIIEITGLTKEEIEKL